MSSLRVELILIECYSTLGIKVTSKGNSFLSQYDYLIPIKRNPRSQRFSGHLQSSNLISRGAIRFGVGPDGWDGVIEDLDKDILDFVVKLEKMDPSLAEYLLAHGGYPQYMTGWVYGCLNGGGDQCDDAIKEWERLFKKFDCEF
jgi:hypothetical protein